VLAVVAYVALWMTRRVLTADALTITQIRVSGNSRLSKGEVIALLDGIRGANMLTVDLDEWRQKLLSSPWVADAAMRRVLPATVAVAIAERQPMGIGRINGELYLIDDRGGLIDQFGPNYAEFDLPIIDGLAAAPRDSSTLVDAGRAALAARVLAALQTRPDLARRVSQIDVSDGTHSSAPPPRCDPRR
jgi:cell division septal protein FtsQ